MLPDELPEGYLAVTAEGWYERMGAYSQPLITRITKGTQNSKKYLKCNANKGYSLMIVLKEGDSRNHLESPSYCLI